MKTLFFLLFFLNCFEAFSFTLMTNPPYTYSRDEVIYNVSSDSCTNSHLTPSGILDLMESAADRFWNKVPNSRLKLKRGEVVSVSVKSESDVIAVLEKISKDTILLGCNDQFSSFDSESTVGVGTIGNLSNGGAVGMVLLNDKDPNSIDELSDLQLESLLAHEVGHALSISHSGNPAALMYYSLSPIQERLSDDDKDALSYIYPKKNLGVGCGTITPIDSSNISGGLMSLVLGFLMVGLLGYAIAREPQRVFY